MKILLWTAAAISILMGAQVSAQEVNKASTQVVQARQGQAQDAAVECSERGRVRADAKRRAKRDDKRGSRRAAPARARRSSDEGQKAGVRKKRRAARRAKPWTRVQFTAGMGISNSADEAKGSSFTAYVGAPLTQRYTAGQFLSLGGRFEAEGCEDDCLSVLAGPALRLGMAQGSRRNTTPDWSIYAEGALLLNLAGDQPSSDNDALFNSDRRPSKDPASIVPRLSVGMSTPAFSRGMKNAIIGRGPIVSYKIILVPLILINHAEVAVEMGGPGGSASEPRLMLFIGGGV